MIGSKARASRRLCPTYGRFKYQPGQVRAFGMLAGGSGITPMFQVARAILENPDDRTKVHLIYANVTSDDILLKDEIPVIVCFGDKQRFLGTAGAASSMMNPKNTISQIKKLIGRQFSDPELQRDIKSVPFAVTEGPDGYPLIHARYLGENRTYTPTQVLGMVLSDLKTIAEKNLNTAVMDCCIGIPIYFTDLQRRVVLDSAKIAGLKPLRIFHETTATALAYGIYKTDLPENEPMNVAFVDVGRWVGGILMRFFSSILLPNSRMSTKSMCTRMTGLA